MKKEDLIRKLKKLMDATAKGKVNWNILVQSTEYNDEKFIEKDDDGIEWTIDECYVNYFSTYQGETFNLITYEMIRTNGSETVTRTFVFLPPDGIRFFNLKTLLPYSIDTDAVTLQGIHMLWNYLLDCGKKNDGHVRIDANSAEIQIEDTI